MRVLHVSPYFAPAFCYGGPPRSILGLCHGLQSLGVTLSVFTTTANGATDLPESPAEGNIYQEIPVTYFRRTTPKRFFGAAAMADAIAACISTYDLIHIHGLWNWPSWMAARIARRRRTPYVISTRGMLQPAALLHGAGPKRIAWRAVERRKLLGAAFLHATSAEEAGTIQKLAPGIPIVTLPNAIDRPEREATAGLFRKRLGLPATTPLGVFLGRIHPIKRLDLLARAFDQLLREHSEAHLAIAGGGRPADERAAREAFSGMRSNVHWLGDINESEKWELLEDATFLVMCSDSENFGMSVAEALSAGVPVVVTRTCPWEEIEAAGCGYWVAQDSAVIASAMSNLAGDADRAAEMGKRARAHAARRLTWGAVADEMLTHYQSVVSGGLRRAS